MPHPLNRSSTGLALFRMSLTVSIRLVSPCWVACKKLPGGGVILAGPMGCSGGERVATISLFQLSRASRCCSAAAAKLTRNASSNGLPPMAKRSKPAAAWVACIFNVDLRLPPSWASVSRTGRAFNKSGCKSAQFGISMICSDACA